MPLLSIIVTVYNLEEYIEQCLESILSYDSEEYEVIIVDDGSKDKSVEICQMYYKRYPDRIKHICLEGPGKLGRAHYIGYEEARGAYIQIIDGDDYLVEGAMEETISLIKNKRADLIMGTFECRIEEGAVAIRDAKINRDLLNKGDYEEVVSYLSELEQFHMVFWRYVFKKEILKRENLFETDVMHTVTTNDWLPVTKMIVSAQSIYFRENVFYVYRRRKNNSVTSKITAGHLLDHFITFIEILKYMEHIDVHGTRKKFIVSRLRLILEIALSGSDLLSEDQVKQIGQYLEECKEGINELKDVRDNKLGLLYRILNEKGPAEGIKEFLNLNKQEVIHKIAEQCKKKMYVFPTGLKAQWIVRILKESINIEGFLDNDLTKNGMKIEGTVCYSLSQIEDLSNKEDIGCIISSIYTRTNLKLREQIISLGIPSENVIMLE